MDMKHIHHVAIIGRDYEKSKHFYVDILGLPVIREHYRQEQQDWKIDLQLQDAELELFIKKDCPERPGWPGKEAYGLRHLAFRVESVEDTARELQAAGVETEPVRRDTFTGEKMTFFHDPDGLPIEIHE
ncbi:MAG: VOC family protein [Selenomonas sp.]|uniref:SMU1112c/YaeR family gloxylase I-like metalloprotein n=1 Tax=Selenomonas sp. TaxID=2053611 RepID=UPI0025EAE170|nr:VOC family protein [Selenomonas sp.]MCR5757968.1 VOC family protein [Selenomonas sp.]